MISYGLNVRKNFVEVFSLDEAVSGWCGRARRWGGLGTVLGKVMGWSWCGFGSEVL